MYILVQILGVLAMIFPIMSFQQKTQKKILFFQIIGNVLFFFHYYLLNAMVGAFLNVIAMLRACVFSQRGTRKWADSVIWIYIFILLGMVSYALTFTVFNMERTAFNLIVETLPVVGISIQTVGFRMKDPFKVRCMYLVSAPFWIVYASIRVAIGGILVDSINIISIIIGIVRIDIKSRNKRD